VILLSMLLEEHKAVLRLQRQMEGLQGRGNLLDDGVTR
jgi:hypothetical protein